MQTDAQVRLEDVSFTYEEASSPAVSHATALIRPGEFVAVLGHNGSGKSTLAKLMNALYTPTEGNVVVCGYDTADEKLVWEIRRRAGMIFQNPDNQIVATVVREDVAFGLENLGVPTEEMIPRIDKALDAVRMTKYADSAPHTLSGGQKQRVAIAGILANMHRESGFKHDKNGDYGNAYGLCQWRLIRMVRLEGYCLDMGYDFETVEGQLLFLAYELQTYYPDLYEYVLLNAADTADGAERVAYYFCDTFECPADLERNLKERCELAVRLYYPQLTEAAKEAEEELQQLR